MSRSEETAREAARWSASSEAWDRWADAFAPQAAKLNAPLLDAADLHPGQFLLDLACGPGEPALTAAARVGGSGLTVACDLVPAMAASARRRDVEKRLHVAAADMGALPFAARSFDRVTCRFGLMFCEDPHRALHEARRVLRVNGRAAYMVWGPVEENSVFRLLRDASVEMFGSAADNLFAALFRYADAGSLSSAMRMAGFGASEEIPVQLGGSADPETPFWRAQLHMCLAPLLLREGRQAVEDIEASLRRRVAINAAGGRFPISVSAKIAVARTS